MIQIQQRSLCSLEQDVFASPRCFVDGAGAIDHVGCQAAPVVGIFLKDRFWIEALQAIDPGKQLVLFGQRPQQPIPQAPLVEQVDDPNAVALRFIGVGGANPSPGGPDASVAAALFHRLIQQAVVRHGDMGGGGQLQPGDVDAVVDQHVDLPQHHRRIHHRAGSNQARGGGVKDAGGDQVQLEHAIINHDRVTGIHTALIAHDDVGRATEQIGDLSLPLVTPLCTDDDDVGQERNGQRPLSSTNKECVRSQGHL